MVERLEHQLEYLQAIQASAWIEKLQDASPTTSNEFVAWLKQSPQNIREFLLALSIEEALGRFDDNRRLDIDRLLGQSGSRVVPFGTSQSRVNFRSNSPFFFGTGIRRAAMAFCTLVLLAISVFFFISPSAWSDVVTAKGEQRTLQLEDGTQIQLNTDTRIQYRLSAKVREIRLLSGEALFTVHHDTARPFRVYTTQASIQAVGTQFNVYDHGDDTIVSVIEGRVIAKPLSVSEVPAPGSTAQMAPDAAVQSISAAEEGRISRSGHIAVRAVSNISDATAWRDGRLVFHDATLGYIAAEVNRYNRQQIRIASDEASARTYSGIFAAGDPQFLAKVLAKEGGLAIEITPSTIVIRARVDAARSHDNRP